MRDARVAPVPWRWCPSVGSSRHVGQRGRPRANLGGSPISDRDNSRNSAACTQSRARSAGMRVAHMGYPTPVGRRTLRRVARAAQHGGVGDVERRTASGERHDVINGQVGGRVGGALVARAPVAVLATPGAQHAGAESLPGPRAVQGVVPAAVGLPGVVRAATTRAAGHNTADRAQLHCSRRPSAVPRLTLVTLEYTPVDIVMSVEREGAAVYSPRVLSPRHQRLRR